MTKENNKPHLVYMTGISVNKRMLNNIVENINYDKDFSYWRKKAIEDLEKSFGFWSKNLGRLKKFGDRQIDTLISLGTGDLINLDNEILDEMTDTEVENYLNEALKKIKNIPKSLIYKVFEGIGFKDINQNLTDEEKILYGKKLKTYIKKLSQLTNGDFFSLYVSNQSDSIGLVPLAQLSNKQNFNLVHTYCDWDFYDNKYIDSVILKVDLDKFNIDTESILKIFKTHIRETIFSYLELKEFDDNQRKPLMSLLTNLQNQSKSKYVKSIYQMLGERNFFGVALLSRILYEIQLKKKLSNNEHSKLNINIDENQVNGKIDLYYLQELLEYSTDPATVNFINANENSDDIDIKAKIYISDGIKYIDENNLKKQNELKKLIEDDFLKAIYNVSDAEWSDYVKKTINYTRILPNENNQDEPFVSYVKKKGKYLYIKVPIKMVLSLPLDVLENQGQEPNNKLYIPKCIDNEKSKYIDILTVGGAEHNRALAHLINKYRFEYKNERLYGFMDNYYDMMHKINEEGKNNDEYDYSFFMGLNQPVSGWNLILSSRWDDDEGNSINSDVKLITFKLKDEKRIYNIVSIYGFSAIASVLGINLFIAEIDENLNSNNNQDLSKGLFAKNFSQYFDGLKINHEKGTASTIFFEPKPKDKVLKEFENKCYQYAYQYKHQKYKNFLEFENPVLQNRILKGKVVNRNEKRTV